MDSSLIALMMLSLFLGCGCWLLFLWAVRDGQFSDIERAKYRMLDDDESIAPPPGGGRLGGGRNVAHEETVGPLPDPPPPSLPAEALAKAEEVKEVGLSDSVHFSSSRRGEAGRGVKCRSEVTVRPLPGPPPPGEGVVEEVDLSDSVHFSSRRGEVGWGAIWRSEETVRPLPDPPPPSLPAEAVAKAEPARRSRGEGGRGSVEGSSGEGVAIKFKLRSDV